MKGAITIRPATRAANIPALLKHPNRWRLHFGAVRAAVWLCFRASDFLLAAGNVADKLPAGLYGASRTMSQAAGRIATQFRHVTDRWEG